MLASQPTRGELLDILEVALQAGQLLIEHGANTARVEETVARIGMGLGADRMDVYATPSGIIASARAGDEHRTRVQRVQAGVVDLSRVAGVLEVSRRIEAGELGRAEARAALVQIARQPRVYGPLATIAASAVGCGCFAVLFGGGPLDALIVLVAAAVGQVLRVPLGRLGLGRPLITTLVAAAVSGLALWLAALLEPLSLAYGDGRTTVPEISVAASVLLLVPGVLMISSVADLFRGDMLSGVARAAAALFMLGAIGAGIWIALLVSAAPVAVGPGVPPALVVGLAAAFAGAIGFAVLFDVPRAAVPTAALVGALAYAVRRSALEAGLPPEAAIFLAGAAIGLLAELLARAQYLPAAMFSIPGFIPLVPGVPAVRAVIDFVQRDYVGGIERVVSTVLLVTALAGGLGVVSSLVRGRRGPRPVMDERKPA